MKRLTKLGIIAALTVIALGTLSCSTPASRAEHSAPQTLVTAMSVNGMLISEPYTVKQGDTLNGIASQYIGKNTYGPRRLDEFAERIKEANPQAFVNGSYVRAGEVLVIRYWVRR